MAARGTSLLKMPIIVAQVDKKLSWLCAVVDSVAREISSRPPSENTRGRLIACHAMHSLTVSLIDCLAAPCVPEHVLPREWMVGKERIVQSVRPHLNPDF